MCIRDRIKEVQKDLEKNNIHAEEAIDGEVFQSKVLKMEGVQGRRDKNAGSKRTEDLSLIHISFNEITKQLE